MESSEDENKHECIPLLFKKEGMESFKYADDDDEDELYMDCLDGDFSKKEVLLRLQEKFEEYVKHRPLEDINQDEIGSQLLHYAVIGKSMELVTAILKKRPADVDAKNRKGRSPLHIAALLNYSDIATELINKHADINLADDNGMTPLLTAANCGSLNVFEILLLNRATFVNVTDKKGKSILHLATARNNTNILKILKKHKKLMKTTHKVEWTKFINMGCSEGKSALHDAVLQNNKESVEILLQEQVNVNRWDKDNRTPLSYAAGQGLVEITKILVDHEACDFYRNNEGMMPIHYATMNGNPEVVRILVNRECAWATNGSEKNCLDIAIDKKHEEAALVIVKSDNWKKFLQNTTGEYQTPMRKLIAHMPDVAREVFNRCTTVDGTGDEFSVNFDYELLDDKHLLGNKWKDVGDVQAVNTMHLIHRSNLGQETTANHWLALSSGQRGKTKPTPYADDANLVKRNHPLMIMITKNRTELLDHPLVSALLKKKWTSIGLIFYLLNVFMYIFYLAMLTGFALDIQVPYQFIGTSEDVNVCSEDPKISEFAVIAKYCVIVSASVELFIEIFEFKVAFSCKFWSYICEKENGLEWIACICSILFVVNTSGCTDTGYRPEWQWTCGTISVFLVWINLLLLMEQFRWFGIYVVMLFQSIQVFMKFMLVFSFLIATFAVIFHCLFQNQEQFSTFWISYVKTTGMMIGELDFNKIFFEEEVHFAFISYVFFYVFMLFMAIIVVNLMVGLAVDMKKFQKNAITSQKKMQVKFALELERFSKSSIYRRLLRCVSSMIFIIELTSQDLMETLQPSKQNWLQRKINTLWKLTEKDIKQALTSGTDGTSKGITELKTEMRNMDLELKNAVRTTNTDLQEGMKSMESRLMSQLNTEEGISKADMQNEMKNMESRLMSKLNEEERKMKTELQEKLKSIDTKLMTIIQNLKRAEDVASATNQPID